jgi:Flp pilus assembly protein TadG
MLRSFRTVLRLAGRFGSEKSGATAVEFGLLAVPFFLLTFGLAEIAMIGFAQTSLDYATSETARLIRTGQAQQGGQTADQIKSTLCGKLTGLLPMDCGNNLYLDVATFTSFANVTNPSPVQNGQFNAQGFGYSPGQPSDIVVVRAFYRWQVITPMFQTVFGNIAGGQRVLASTMMFRNEPWGAPAAP